MELSRKHNVSGFSEARAGPQGEARESGLRKSARDRLRPGLRRATLGARRGA